MLTAIYSLGACVVYYYFWVRLIPKWGNYQLRQTVLHDDNGTTAHKLVKVPNEELASWDEKYDFAGRLRQRPQIVETDGARESGNE
jgi:hypothetical protein